MKMETHPCWRGGRSFEIYPVGWNKTFKEQIRYRDGYKCQLCGTPEAECKTKLHVHHIDYNKRNIDQDNLISLCSKCHVRTNHEREFWKSYFNAPEEVLNELNTGI
jgi:5-methylcytosine-specific restriction endonuclease McrA